MKFLEDPRVTERLDALKAAIEEVTGGQLKTFLLAVDTGQSSPGAGMAFEGCNCPICALRMLTMIGRAYSGDAADARDRAETLAMAARAAGRVH